MTICGIQNSAFSLISTNAFQELRKYGPDKGWLGYKPPNQLYADSFVYTYESILDILTEDEEQLSNGLVIIVLTAHPLQQDKGHQYKGCVAYGQVIAHPVEFFTKSQKEFAGFKTTFNRPAVSITPDNLTGRQAAVC